MNVLYVGAGTALMALFQIEQYFCSGETSPLLIVVQHDNFKMRMLVKGLPYFDAYGRVELPFDDLDKVEELKIRSLEQLEREDFRGQYKKYKSYYRRQEPMNGVYKAKFNAPSKERIKHPIRIRSKC